MSSSHLTRRCDEECEKTPCNQHRGFHLRRPPTRRLTWDVAAGGQPAGVDDLDPDLRPENATDAVVHGRRRVERRSMGRALAAACRRGRVRLRTQHHHPWSKTGAEHEHGEQVAIQLIEAADPEITRQEAGDQIDLAPGPRPISTIATGLTCGGTPANNCAMPASGGSMKIVATCGACRRSKR